MNDCPVQIQDLTTTKSECKPRSEQLQKSVDQNISDDFLNPTNRQRFDIEEKIGKLVSQTKHVSQGLGLHSLVSSSEMSGNSQGKNEGVELAAHTLNHFGGDLKNEIPPVNSSK
mmetsp:Transcript_12322/g.14073  ORF Transcript_12322/g.14073 Transcript_12322/m.14073 type:complete len:114 (-) Transcript_12322:109-450(-)